MPKVKMKEKHHGPGVSLVKVAVYAKSDVVNSNFVVVHIRRQHSHRLDFLVTQLMNLCEMKENYVGNFQCAAREITSSYWNANGP